MEELEEGLKVTVEESEEPKEQSVKELAYSFQLLDTYNTSLDTEKINGKLLALIISSDKQVSITITSVDNPSIIIYEKPDFFGSFYLPVMITAVSKSANQFNWIAQPYYLNEALNISIRGQLETSISVKIRWCSD
jgi:hypothetical protein